jgi:2-succinyl-5-enolpyruvyl-6-hydroxy-3-cyclohexene-1-carboxylate synthase
VQTLASKLGYPILADPLSQLRCASADADFIIDSYDAFLRSSPLKSEAAFDVVLRFGAMPVSKALTLFLKEHLHKEHYIIDGSGGWRDPIGAASYMIASDEVEFCRGLSRKLPMKAQKSAWLSKWQQLNHVAKEAMGAVKNQTGMEEGRLFYEMIQLLPDHSSLFVGNSMPIRDLDSFFFVEDRQVKLYANRGANGIDGLVSSALGVAAVDQSTYLVLGDLSFFHDLNGLLAAKLNGIKMTVIAVNNNGGGIFSYLPQAASPKHFELLFGTPADLDFSHAANFYGAGYQQAADLEQFASAMEEAERAEGLYIIEVITDRAENVEAHRNLWSSVSQEISKLTAGDDFWR